MKRCFDILIGILLMISTYSLWQDMLGLEGYIDFIREHWVASSLTIPFAIFCQILVIGYLIVSNKLHFHKWRYIYSKVSKASYHHGNETTILIKYKKCLCGQKKAAAYDNKGNKLNFSSDYLIQVEDKMELL